MKWFKDLINKIRYTITRERRRFPRYEFVAEGEAHKFFSVDGIAAYLHAPEQAVEEPHPIINLSEGGIALFLLEGEDPESFKAHPKLTLKLYVEGQLLTLPSEVVYVIGGLRRMGLKFSQISKQQREVIAKFLDVHFLASTLKEIPIKKQRSWDQVCRWHHGMNNTELFSWETRDGHVLRHLFIFVNRVVEWTAGGGARTGLVRREDFALTYTVLHSSEPNPIDYDEEKDSRTIDMAHKIMELAVIDPVLKKHFLDNVA